MRRVPIVAGNWKMHGSRAEVDVLLRDILSSPVEDVELIVLPPFVFLEQTNRMLDKSAISWGAQNLSCHPKGAFTGEISASMLLEFGCRYVIVGHSERRYLYSEDNELIAKKFVVSIKAGLRPILCVGETLAEREAGRTEQVIEQQIETVLALLANMCELENTVIAYEPVWAIGTGETATPELAEAVHVSIRKQIAKFDSGIAERVRILYGGSVKPDNAAELFAMPNIDGGLIGGASLKAKSFLAIANAWPS